MIVQTSHQGCMTTRTTTLAGFLTHGLSVGEIDQSLATSGPYESSNAFMNPRTSLLLALTVVDGLVIDRTKVR